MGIFIIITKYKMKFITITAILILITYLQAINVRSVPNDSKKHFTFEQKRWLFPSKCTMCKSVVSKMIGLAAKGLTCTAIDISGDAVCLALNAEDFEILGVGCAAMVDVACPIVMNKVKSAGGNAAASDICKQISIA